jgi:hypothetical protein
MDNSIKHIYVNILGRHTSNIIQKLGQIDLKGGSRSCGCPTWSKYRIEKNVIYRIYGAWDYICPHVMM